MIEIKESSANMWQARTTFSSCLICLNIPKDGCRFLVWGFKAEYYTGKRIKRKTGRFSGLFMRKNCKMDFFENIRMRQRE